MASEKTVIIYHYKFVRGSYKCTSFEAVETAAQYKLTTDSGSPSYRRVVKKTDLDRITRTHTTYEMFSAVYEPKCFSAKLYEILIANKKMLQQEIAELDKEINILNTIT